MTSSFPGHAQCNLRLTAKTSAWYSYNAITRPMFAFDCTWKKDFTITIRRWHVEPSTQWHHHPTPYSKIVYLTELKGRYLISLLRRWSSRTSYFPFSFFWVNNKQFSFLMIKGLSLDRPNGSLNLKDHMRHEPWVSGGTSCRRATWHKAYNLKQNRQKYQRYIWWEVWVSMHWSTAKNFKEMMR